MSQLRATACVRRASAAVTTRHSRSTLGWRWPSIHSPCCALHSRSGARVAAVFGGDDAYSAHSPAQPAAASSSAPSTSTTPRASSGLLRGLSSLFAGLPPTAATASAASSAPPPLNSPVFVLPQPRVIAPSSAAPAVSFVAPVPASEAASAAQTAITYITPQFLVYVRANSPASDEEAHHEARAVAAAAEAPLTPQSILQQSYDAGLGWSDEQGIAARHIMLVSASESGLDFSSLAGFECHQAFYLTFPRHETRSVARVKFLQYGLVGARASMARKMDSELGWRMVRYPAQLMLRGVPIAPNASGGRGAKTAASRLPFGGIGSGGSKEDRKLDPRALLSLARGAGLAGWDVLDESFFEDWRPTSIGGGSLPTHGLQRFDYAIRVPPLAKYMEAVVAIAKSSASVQSKLGWTVQPAPRLEGDVPTHAGEQGIQIVPILPTKSIQRTTPTPAAAATNNITTTTTQQAQQTQQAITAAAITANIAPPTTAATVAAVIPTTEAAATVVIPPSAFPSSAPLSPVVAGSTTATSAFIDTPPLVTAATVAPSSASSLPPATDAAAPAAIEPDAPIPAPVSPRCYFYRVDDQGRFFLEGGAPGSRSELQDRSALRMIIRALRRSQDLLEKDATFKARANVPIEIPLGCALWGQAHLLSTAAAAAAAAASSPSSSSSPPPLCTVPLSLIPTEYPWVASCAGELNFVRSQVVPVVFRALKVDRKAHTHVLQYAADLTTPFKPAQLLVDEAGRLFHPAPPLLPISAANAVPPSSAASSSSLPAVNPLNLGLLRSHLALELDLQESPFTAAEERLSHKQAVEERRLQIEAHEEYQRRLENGEKISGRADAWIAAKVKQTLDQANVRHLSNFVCVWEGQTYRIGQLDHKVGPIDYAGAAPVLAASPRQPFAR